MSLELLKKKGKAPPALSRIGSSTGVIGVRVTVVRTKKEAEILREILVRDGGLAGVIGTTEAPPVSLEALSVSGRDLPVSLEAPLQFPDFVDAE